jgi:hypothetical protein
MDMTYFVILEIAVGVATIALALYRKFLSVHDESYVHLGPGEEVLISRQVRTARKIQRVDRWGEGMTVVTAAGGILLAVLYLARAWETALHPW